MSVATVLVQNIAALCNVTEAIPAILNSARTHANKDKTFFLLRPFSSDHLGTIHTLSMASSHNNTLVIVMPEVLITSDDALMRLPNVCWTHDGENIEYCPVRVEYGWGSGKQEVNTFLNHPTHSTQPTHSTHSTITIPATKGLCCVVYKDISSASRSKGAFRVPLSMKAPTHRKIPWKNTSSVFCEHAFTENFITSVADASNGQTHVGAVQFDIGDNLTIVGCHLTFQGSHHPDTAGAVVRKKQIEAIQKHVGNKWKEDPVVQGASPHRLCIVGDINLRPTLPSGTTVQECRCKVDAVLSLTIPTVPSSSPHTPIDTSNTMVKKETISCSSAMQTTTTTATTEPSWSSTLEWLSTPFCNHRTPPLHPPTYPIQNHSLWELFLSRKDQEIHQVPSLLFSSRTGKIFESPMHLSQEHYYYHMSGPEDNDNATHFEQLKGGEEKREDRTWAMYDSYKKSRFTPSSWTDGMLMFTRDEMVT